MTDVEDNKKGHRNPNGHALIWASLMIASALVIKDEKTASSMLFLLLAGWAAMMTLNGGFKQAMACEAAFFRKLLGRGPSLK